MTSLTVHYTLLYLTGDYSTMAEADHDVNSALTWSLISAPIGIFSGLCTRLSICLSLLRIFRTTRKWRWSLYIVMFFTTAVIIPGIVTVLAQCSPVKKLWNPLLPGTCWSTQTVVKIGYFNGGKHLMNKSFPIDPSLSIHQERRHSVTGHLLLCQSSLCGTYR